jgi:hypothetical protein
VILSLWGAHRVWRLGSRQYSQSGDRRSHLRIGAKQAAEKLGIWGETGEKHPSGAEARVILEAFTARLKSSPFKTELAAKFSATFKVVP